MQILNSLTISPYYYYATFTDYNFKGETLQKYEVFSG